MHENSIYLMGNLKLRGKVQGVFATTKSCHFKDRPHSSLSMALSWDIYNMLIEIFIFLLDRGKRFGEPHPSTYHISVQGTLKRDIPPRETAPGSLGVRVKIGWAEQSGGALAINGATEETENK